MVSHTLKRLRPRGWGGPSTARGATDCQAHTAWKNCPGRTSNMSNRMLSQSFQFSNHKKQHIDAHDYTHPTVQSSLFPVRSTSQPRCLNSPHPVL